VGAVMALKGRGTTQVRVVAFDANTQLIADLQNRQIIALIVQDPFRMGYESVKAIGQKLQGETPSKQIDTGATLITRADMEKPDIVSLLYPDLSKWLSNPKQ
jgi:ribose transport system substrate-binding protein